MSLASGSCQWAKAGCPDYPEVGLPSGRGGRARWVRRGVSAHPAQLGTPGLASPDSPSWGLKIHRLLPPLPLAVWRLQSGSSGQRMTGSLKMSGRGRGEGGAGVHVSAFALFISSSLRSLAYDFVFYVGVRVSAFALIPLVRACALGLIGRGLRMPFLP